MNVKVDLRLAYAWECPECKKMNFGLPPNISLTDDERKMVIESIGVGPENDGDLVAAPTEVTCTNPECLRSFETNIESDD